MGSIARKWISGKYTGTLCDTCSKLSKKNCHSTNAIISIVHAKGKYLLNVSNKTTSMKFYYGSWYRYLPVQTLLESLCE